MTTQYIKKNLKNNKFILVIIIIYLTMLLFGMVENIKGVSFTLIKDEFKVGYSSQGSLASFSWFGYVLFCIVATFSLEKFGSKKSLVFGYIFTAIGCILVFLSNSFIMITISLMVVWMGFGFFEVGNNALATTIFKSNSAIYMNLMHFFYGFGAVLGPKFAGSIVENFNFSFKGIYLLTLIPVLIVLCMILFAKLDIDETNEEEKGSMKIKDALKNKYVWIFSLCLGFMEVVEFSAPNWGAFYLRDTFNINPVTIGATFVSAYYIFFTISRLFSGFIIEKIGYTKSIIYSLITMFILYIIGFSSGVNGIFILALTGFFIGIMWPTLMCVAMDIFKKDAAIATSVIIVLSGTINGIMQLFTGIINEHVGDVWGYRLSTLYVLIPLIVIIFIHKNNKQLKIGLSQ